MASQSNISTENRTTNNHVIDIFNKFAIITLNYNVDELINGNQLIIPSEAILDTINIYDDHGKSVLFIIENSKYSESDEYGHIANVKMGDDFAQGILIDSDDKSVTIRENSVTRKIFNPIEIIKQTCSVKSDPTKVTLYGRLDRTIYLQFATKQVLMYVDYMINMIEGKLSILRRFHIKNNNINYDFSSINLYDGNISLKPTNNFNDKHKLLHLEGPISSNGIIVSMSEPITTTYQEHYEHIIGSKETKSLYSFITPKYLASGNAKLYKDNKYIGTNFILGHRSGEIVKLYKGISSLNTISKVTITQLNSQTSNLSQNNSSNNNTINSFEANDNISSTADTSNSISNNTLNSTSNNTSNSTSNNTSNLILNDTSNSISNEVPKQLEKSVKILISLINTFDEPIMVSLVYNSSGEIRSLGNYKPSIIKGNSYEWRVTFKPNQNGSLLIDLIQS